MELKPGRGRPILLCRNIVHGRPEGEEESNAIVFMDGAKFSSVDKYAWLAILGPDESPASARVALILRELALAPETTGTGTSTRVRGDLTIESDRNLHNARLSVAFSDGVKPLEVQTFDMPASLRVTSPPTRPFDALVAGEHRGLALTFTLANDGGTWTFARRLGTPKATPITQADLHRPSVSSLMNTRWCCSILTVTSRRLCPRGFELSPESCSKLRCREHVPRQAAESHLLAPLNHQFILVRSILWLKNNSECSGLDS